MSNIEIVKQISEIASTSVNVPLIVVLLAIGTVIKHQLTKVSNDTIPVIMLVSGVLFAIALNVPFNFQKDVLDVLVQGIVSGAAAVGIHTQGKTVFTLFTNSSKTALDELEENNDETNK